MLLCQGYQTEQLPTVSPLPPNPYPVSDLKKKKKKCQTSTTVNTPSYRHQNNRHDIVGP